jgi:hypothetical protein
LTCNRELRYGVEKEALRRAVRADFRGADLRGDIFDGAVFDPKGPRAAEALATPFQGALP